MCGEHLDYVTFPKLRVGIIPACAGSTRSRRAARAWRRDHPRMCGEHSDALGQVGILQGSSPHVRGAHGTKTLGLLFGGIIPACAGSTWHQDARTVVRRDHPRMCGEHVMCLESVWIELGSSPHVRGAPGVDGRLRRCGGIIPACAGSTRRNACGRFASRDHPRMCGEHGEIEVDGCACPGSSPHVRGALAVIRFWRTIVGIIPACAGSTAPADHILPSCRDHPRMCGEHDGVQAILTTDKGSSPHVRGARFLLENLRHFRGIIPACAGSTVARAPVLTPSRDHPRMCGEHVFRSRRRMDARGSSPHVRGARLVRGVQGVALGIIPACAGSTTSPADTCPHHRDHPRMCGEHPLVTGQHTFGLGSSPHVRGALHVTRSDAWLVGIIPACAGSTPWTKPKAWTCRDHPRMCGEHITGNADDAVKAGSSPHVRGAHTCAVFGRYNGGIIPACAGSTLRK